VIQTDVPDPIETTPSTAGNRREGTEAPEAAVVPSPSKTVPDRDAFVLAWGDTVLTGLRPRTRMLYNVGHFVSAEGGIGVFALPNAFHVQMADPHRDEVEAALSAHFGVSVKIELVIDARSNTPPKNDRDDPGSRGGLTVALDGSDAASPALRPTEETVDLDDVLDPGDSEGEPIATGAEWATDRIRAVFPGAEEVPS